MNESTPLPVDPMTVAAGDGITTVGAAARFAGAAKEKGSTAKRIKMSSMMAVQSVRLVEKILVAVED